MPRGGWGLIVKEVLGDHCTTCRKTDVRLDIDHIVPLSKGGAHALSNLQLLCRSCHTRKTALDNDPVILKDGSWVSREFADFARRLIAARRVEGSPLLPRPYSHGDEATLSEVSRLLGLSGGVVKKHVTKMVALGVARLVPDERGRNLGVSVVFDVPRIYRVLGRIGFKEPYRVKGGLGPKFTERLQRVVEAYPTFERIALTTTELEACLDWTFEVGTDRRSLTWDFAKKLVARGVFEREERGRGKTHLSVFNVDLVKMRGLLLRQRTLVVATPVPETPILPHS